MRNIQSFKRTVPVSYTHLDVYKRQEVAKGYECGISLERFADIKEGDIFEGFIMEEYSE